MTLVSDCNQYEYERGEETALRFIPDYPGSDVKLIRYGMEKPVTVVLLMTVQRFILLVPAMTRISMWLLLNTRLDTGKVIG